MGLHAGVRTGAHTVAATARAMLITGTNILAHAAMTVSYR